MRDRFRLPALLSFPLAALLAACALGGIAIPAVYAREHPSWAAQGMGQDWVDLLLAAPLMAVSAYLTLRRSRLFTLLLAGLLAYTAYSLVLYALAMHFGPLFLFYSWGLGLAFFALVTIVCGLCAEDVRGWFAGDAPSRLAGGVAAVLGGAYYLLWLSEVVPALASGGPLKSAAEAGLITNPVQALDLGIVLPAFFVGGIALARGRALGYWLATMMLGFGVTMNVALVGMAISVRSRLPGSAAPPIGVLAVATIVTAAALAGMLRKLMPAPRT